MERNEHFKRYERELVPPRSIFSNKIKPLLEEKDPRHLLMFWINFSSLGVKMTEFVEDWIKKAGEKTEALGYKDLGKKLIKHARHEKDHHLMMIKDAHKLVEIWNQRFLPPRIEINGLFKRQSKKSVLDYQKLHEDCINSVFPFAQIAIEYEIENLSVVHGPTVIENAVSTFGNEIKPCLTFVLDHVTIDQAHTAYNQDAIAEFVNEHPENVDKLIEIGSLALEIYGKFLSDCYECREIFETSPRSLIAS